MRGNKHERWKQQNLRIGFKKLRIREAIRSPLKHRTPVVLRRAGSVSDRKKGHG